MADDLFPVYDEILKSSQKMANPQLRGSLYTAADTSPDEEAHFQKLSKKVGLPVEALRVDRGAEARRLATVQGIEQLPQDAPAAADWLANQENAGLAHDDTENLSMAERLLTSAGNFLRNDIPALATTYGARIGAGYQKSFGGLLRFISESDEPMTTLYGEEHDKRMNAYFADLAQKGANIAAEGRGIAAEVEKEKPLRSYPGKILGNAVESIGAMVPGIAGSIATLNPGSSDDGRHVRGESGERDLDRRLHGQCIDSGRRRDDDGTSPLHGTDKVLQAGEDDKEACNLLPCGHSGRTHSDGGPEYDRKVF